MDSNAGGVQKGEKKIGGAPHGKRETKKKGGG